MITLKKCTYGGIDWHDSKTMIAFILTEDGSYDHLSEDNARMVMRDNIISQFPDEAEKIIKAFETNEPVEFPIKVGHYDANGEYIEDSYGEVIVEGSKTYYEDSVTVTSNDGTPAQVFVKAETKNGTTYTKEVITENGAKVDISDANGDVKLFIWDSNLTPLTRPFVR